MRPHHGAGHGPVQRQAAGGALGLDLLNAVRPNYFDEDVAARYDVDEADMFAAEVIALTVGFLTGLAGSGPVLELGIGTGRVAIPLHQRGFDVHGIELSEAMAAK